MEEEEKNFGCVYKHTLTLDCEAKGKSYIGITKKTPEQRGLNGRGYKDNTIFCAAVKKYGGENFSHEILENNIESLEEANAREQYGIYYYHTYVHDDNSNGYNMTRGGDGTLGAKLSEEAKIKISNAKKGKPAGDSGKKYTEEQKKNMRKKHSPMTEEHKRKISENSTHSFLGKHHTAETRKKISEKLKGRVSGMRGKHHTDEAKEKLRIANTGKPSAFKGKHHSEESRKKLSEAKNNIKVKVKCLDTNIIYDSIVSAYKSTGCSRNQIRDCCNGKVSAVKGLHGVFVDNEKEAE